MQEQSWSLIRLNAGEVRQTSRRFFDRAFCGEAGRDIVPGSSNQLFAV